MCTKIIAQLPRSGYLSFLSCWSLFSVGTFKAYEFGSSEVMLMWERSLVILSSYRGLLVGDDSPVALDKVCVWLGFCILQGNIKLYLQLLDLEYQCRPISEENVIKIFASILDCENFPLETKAKMSQRKLEFLEDFCASITTYVSVNCMHCGWFVMPQTFGIKAVLKNIISHYCQVERILWWTSETDEGTPQWEEEEAVRDNRDQVSVPQ